MQRRGGAHPDGRDGEPTQGNPPRFRDSARQRVMKRLVKARDVAVYQVKRRTAVHRLVFTETTEVNLQVQRLFLLERKLGEGGYSTVWRVKERQPDGRSTAFAVKRIVLDPTDEEQASQVRREIECMRSLPPHPNILALEGYCYSASAKSRGANQEVYMLLELCRGGSLADLLIQRATATPLSPAEVLRIFLELCQALAHLHAQSPALAHRDIKPENFLLSAADSHWKLCDFGSASRASFCYSRDVPEASASLAAEEDRVHRFSTPQYRAPEMCDLYAGLPINQAVDVWALGVCLYKMLFLRDLFGVPGEERLAVLNFDADKEFGPSARSLVSGTALLWEAQSRGLFHELLRMCFRRSPLQRPGVHEILQWLSAEGSRLAPSLPTSSHVARHYCAGTLRLRVEAARGLYPKGPAGVVHPYVLVSCGGTRRRTDTAPRTVNPEWQTNLTFVTHSMQVVELSVWAAQNHLPDDFLGVVALPLEGLLGNPSVPRRVASSWRPLQRRSHRSRVSGDLSVSCDWAPFPRSAPPSSGADAVAGSHPLSEARRPTAVGPPPFSSPATQFSQVSVQKATIPADAAVGDGEFWAAFDNAPPSDSDAFTSENSFAPDLENSYAPGLENSVAPDLLDLGEYTEASSRPSATNGSVWDDLFGLQSTSAADAPASSQPQPSAAAAPALLPAAFESILTLDSGCGSSSAAAAPDDFWNDLLGGIGASSSTAVATHPPPSTFPPASTQSSCLVEDLLSPFSCAGFSAAGSSCGVPIASPPSVVSSTTNSSNAFGGSDFMAAAAYSPAPTHPSATMQSSCLTELLSPLACASSSAAGSSCGTQGVSAPSVVASTTNSSSGLSGIDSLGAATSLAGATHPQGATPPPHASQYSCFLSDRVAPASCASGSAAGASCGMRAASPPSVVASTSTSSSALCSSEPVTPRTPARSVTAPGCAGSFWDSQYVQSGL